jgi:hypothetical protein
MSNSHALAKLREFSESLKVELPTARIELTEFPSGAAMLDVVIDNRLFVLEYYSNGQCGAGEVHEDEGFLLGHPFVSDDWPGAAAYLRGVVLAAASGAHQPATV